MEKSAEKKAFQGLKDLLEIFREKEQEYLAEREKLEGFVEGYLDENGIWGDMERLEEVIDVLPAGILRFRLLDCYYELEKNMAAQQCMQDDSADLAGDADGLQVSGGMQVQSMGGM